MNILRNVAVVIIAIVVGSIVNMSIVSLGPMLVPYPAGLNPQDIESLKQNIHLLEFKHLVFPFLAHSLGTLVAAFLVTLGVTTQRKVFALCLGGFFMLGGIAAAVMIPASMLFIVIDLVFAYLPMAWLGYKIAQALFLNKTAKN